MAEDCRAAAGISLTDLFDRRHRPPRAHPTEGHPVVAKSPPAGGNSRRRVVLWALRTLQQANRSISGDAAVSSSGSRDCRWAARRSSRERPDDDKGQYKCVARTPPFSFSRGSWTQDLVALEGMMLG